jgi:hypothetical protein
VRVLNPWPGKPVIAREAATGKRVAGMTCTNDVLTFPARAERSYRVEPAASRGE